MWLVEQPSPGISLAVSMRPGDRTGQRSQGEAASHANSAFECLRQDKASSQIGATEGLLIAPK